MGLQMKVLAPDWPFLTPLWGGGVRYLVTPFSMWNSKLPAQHLLLWVGVGPQLFLRIWLK